MKTFCILALVLALLCPPLAQAESPHTDEATQELVANLLDQAMRVDSMERRVERTLPYSTPSRHSTTPASTYSPTA